MKGKGFHVAPSTVEGWMVTISDSCFPMWTLYHELKTLQKRNLIFDGLPLPKIQLLSYKIFKTIIVLFLKLFWHLVTIKCSTINIWISFRNVIFMIFGSIWLKNRFLKILWRLIVEKIIDHFLFQRCQRKRYKWVYNIFKDFLAK